MVSQVPLPIGLAGFVMLVEELRGILVHLSSPVMNGRRMLMCPGMPALMLLLQAFCVVFAHNASFSQEVPESSCWNLSYRRCADRRIHEGARR